MGAMTEQHLSEMQQRMETSAAQAPTDASVEQPQADAQVKQAQTGATPKKGPRVISGEPEEPRYKTWKDVNYLDLMIWGDGYAFPYHVKRMNIYDLFIDWGGSTAAMFRWDLNRDKNANFKDKPYDIQRMFLYLYFNARYQNWLRYYVKFRDIYHGNDYAPTDNMNEGPDVDQMYVDLMFEPFTLTAGRQFHKIGRGHVYRDNIDAFKLIYSDDFVDVDMYVGKMLGDNQDPYIPNNHQNKYPLGITATYKEFMKHLFQGYVLGVVDKSDDQLYYRQTHYKPVYFGLYGVGRFDIDKYRVKSISYYTETVKVYGRSNVSDFSPMANRYDTETIDAFLLDFGAIVKFDHRWKPEWENEFAWGSGDDTVPIASTIVVPPSSIDVDRIAAANNPGFKGTPGVYLNQGGSVYSTMRGNPKGSRDTNFKSADGYVNYGVALNPVLSNLLVWKSGLKFNPMKRIVAEINHFAYWKQCVNGPMSDAVATLQRAYVGNEIDLGLEYEMTKYSRLTFNYGHFFTGSAYPQDWHTDEDFFQMIYQYVF